MTSPPASRGGRFGEAIYRSLLRLYPESFRREFELVLVEAFHYRRRSALRRFGPAGLAALWTHILGDLWTSVRRERRGSAGGVETSTLGVEPLRFPRRAVPSEGDAGGLSPQSGDRYGPGRRSSAAARFASAYRDFRFAWRNLRRQPGFAAMSIFIIALGIGGNTGVFSVVNGVLLAELPYAEANRIVRLWANEPAEGIEDFSFTKVEYRHFFANNSVFESIGGDFPTTLTVTGDGEPELLRAALVTPGYFEVFGVLPALGRFVTFDDIDAADLDVVVISHGFWQRRLGGDPGAIGKTLLLNGRAMVVLGVLPATYRHLSDDYDIFVPYTLGTDGWIGRWLELSANLKPGVTIEQAQANLDAMLATIAESEERTRGWVAAIEPLDDWATGGARSSILAMVGAVSLLLLLACANVANLMLARATTRQRETAIRLSLGAGRSEIVRQSLAEGLILGVLGGAAGVVLALWFVPLVIALGAHALPRLSVVAIDFRVLAFAVVASVGSGLLFGAAPAWFSARSISPEGSLRDGSNTVAGRRGAQRLLHGLVIAEIALALALLVGAGLLMRSFQSLLEVDLGVVDADSVVAASISLPGARYPEAAATHAFFDELTERVGARPGVGPVSLTAYLPLGGREAVGSMNSDYLLARGSTELVGSLQRIVRNDYFRTMGVRLHRGRLFDERLDPDRPEQVILSESMARRLWPGIDPVGRRMTWRSDPTDEQWIEVIGVVADVRYETIDGALTPQYYESHYDQSWREMYLVARTTIPPAEFLAAVRESVAEIDADVPVSSVTTIGALASESMAPERFNLLVFGAFGATALVLACAGIYGVLSFVVRQQTREIGVRKAVGASRAAVFRWVLGRAAALIAAGLGAGIVLSMAASRLLGSLLFEVDALDPLVYIAVAALLALVALWACWRPAAQASRVDAMIALRDQ